MAVLVVAFTNFPLLCVSKIHTEVDMSALNSGYVVFSHSVRYLLPFKIIIKEMVDNLVTDIKKMKFVSICTFYEDNYVPYLCQQSQVLHLLQITFL